MAYDYIRQVEVNGVNVPVGHAEIATWASDISDVFVFTLTGECEGVLEIDVVTLIGTARLSVNVCNSILNGFYHLTAHDIDLDKYGNAALFEPVSFMYNTSDTLDSVTFRIQYGEGNEDGTISLRVRAYMPNTAITEGTWSSDVAAGALELKRQQTIGLLTPGQDYGDTLPDAGSTGRIFFKKV